jgi:hypothetical protein
VKTTFLALTLALLLNASVPASAGGVKGKPKVVETDVCSVLETPKAFVNQVIRLRGFVYLGEDHMNISSKDCPSQGIELVIKSDSVPKQKDVHHFYVQMNHQGRKGFATLTGIFEKNSSPLTPYVLNIQHVKDVAPPH